MNTLEKRVLKLEAQMNAMAQAWIYLAATMEMQANVDMGPMETALKDKAWPMAPEIDAEARHTVAWLCRELQAGRAVRAARDRDAAGEE